MPTVTLATTGTNKENILTVTLQGIGHGGGARWGGVNGFHFNETADVPVGKYKATFTVPGYENDENIEIRASGTLTVEDNDDNYDISFA